MGTLWESGRGAVRELHAKALDGLRSVRFTVHVLQGRTPRGHSLSILYAGSQPYRHYFENLAFAEQRSERALGRYWRWQLPALAGRVGADVRVTRCARALRGMLEPHAATYYVPEWLWCEVDIDARTREMTGKEWRRILRNGLTYAPTSEPQALRHFYERMYLPLTMKSHGHAAQLMGLDTMLRRAAKGEAELVSILQRGLPVGGCFVVYGERQPRLFSQGVLDADDGLLRQRVGVAIYLYSFVHLLERGFRRVSLGRSRPFLADGALRFKLERGAEITGATATGIEIEVLNAGVGASELLAANPWIGEDDDGLVGVSFRAADAAAAPREPPRGVARVEVVPLVSAALVRPVASGASILPRI